MLNAERILKRGETLGMFPEGTRSKTGYVGKPHPGTALIAIPGTAIGLAVIWAIGVRQERQQELQA